MSNTKLDLTGLKNTPRKPINIGLAEVLEEKQINSPLRSSEEIQLAKSILSRQYQDGKISYNEMRNKRNEIKKLEDLLRSVNKCDKIIETTTKIIKEVAHSATDEESLHKEISKQVLENDEREHKRTRGRIERVASYEEFQVLHGLPLKIMNEIISRYYYDERIQKNIVRLDTPLLKSQLKITQQHLAVQISRMVKQGWFKIISSKKSGIRLIEVDPRLFKK